MDQDDIPGMFNVTGNSQGRKVLLVQHDGDKKPTYSCRVQTGPGKMKGWHAHASRLEALQELAAVDGRPVDELLAIYIGEREKKRNQAAAGLIPVQGPGVLEANAAAAANAEPAGAQHNPEAQHAVQSDRFFGAASRMHQQQQQQQQQQQLTRAPTPAHAAARTPTAWMKNYTGGQHMSSFTPGSAAAHMAADPTPHRTTEFTSAEQAPYFCEFREPWRRERQPQRQQDHSPGVTFTGPQRPSRQQQQQQLLGSPGPQTQQVISRVSGLLQPASAPNSPNRFSPYGRPPPASAANPGAQQNAMNPLLYAPKARSTFSTSFPASQPGSPFQLQKLEQLGMGSGQAGFSPAQTSSFAGSVPGLSSAAVTPQHFGSSSSYALPHPQQSQPARGSWDAAAASNGRMRSPSTLASPVQYGTVSDPLVGPAAKVRLFAGSGPAGPSPIPAATPSVAGSSSSFQRQQLLQHRVAVHDYGHPDYAAFLGGGPDVSVRLQNSICDGKGSSCFVYSGVACQGGDGGSDSSSTSSSEPTVAVKVLRTPGAGSSEVNVMQQLVGVPNAAQLLATGSLLYGGSTYTCLIMPLLRSTLKDSCKHAEGYCKPEQQRTVMQQVLGGMVALHELKIAHRDVKSSNIFIASDGTAFLGDFGISSPMIDGIVDTREGTPLYKPPSVDGEQHGELVDTWGLGVVMLDVLLSGDLAGRIGEQNARLPHFALELELFVSGEGHFFEELDYVRTG